MLRLVLVAALALLGVACSATPEGLRRDLDRWHAERAALPDQAAPRPALPAEPVARDLVEQALLRNRGVRAAFHQWRAALERVPQAGALPAPLLNFSAAVLGNLETRNGPLIGSVGMSQTLPWFGTLDARADAELLAAAATREAFAAARLDVIREVRDAWYEYHYLARAVAITEGHLELLRYGESVARSRYETDAGPFSDVTRAQLELGVLEDRLRTLKDRRRPLVARLNAALDRPAAESLPWPAGSLPVPAKVDPATLHAELAGSSPHLRVHQLRAEAARAGIVAAEKSGYPSFTVGAEYSFLGGTSLSGAPNPGEDVLGLRVGISLPFLSSRAAAAAREARASEVAAEASFDDAVRQAASRLEEALYEMRDGGRRASLYRDTLLPKAEESLQATLAAYETGAATFLDYLDSERVLLEFLLSAARAETDRAQAMARAEHLTGVPLERLP